jgi:hypothetical protein
LLYILYHYHILIKSKFDVIHPSAQTLGKRSQVDVRQHKIRIVERLGSVKSALHDDGPIAGASSGSRDTTALDDSPVPGESAVSDFASIEWLDDSSLDQLSTADLEKLSDRLIDTVMRDLLRVFNMENFPFISLHVFVRPPRPPSIIPRAILRLSFFSTIHPSIYLFICSSFHSCFFAV